MRTYVVSLVLCVTKTLGYLTKGTGKVSQRRMSQSVTKLKIVVSNKKGENLGVRSS